MAAGGEGCDEAARLPAAYSTATFPAQDAEYTKLGRLAHASHLLPC